MTLSDARAADRAGDLKRAAALYEDVLASGERSIEVLLDLALLYWQSTDPGMAAGKKLDVAFLRLADERYPELLSEAARAFPQSTAVRFWMKYIDWAELDEESISVEECKQLLQEDPTVLVPAMVVFGVSDGHEMRSEARQLLRQCKKSGTTGALYVASVIDAVMTRVGHR